MITIFFTARQRILLDVLPKGSKFNQQYFIDCMFPDLKTENRNFRRRTPLANFWVQMDNSMCHNWSKFDKYHIARLSHPASSPDLSLCDFWLFRMLKRILKDQEFHLHNEIEEAITMAWNDLRFDKSDCIRKAVIWYSASESFHFEGNDQDLIVLHRGSPWIVSMPFLSFDFPARFIHTDAQLIKITSISFCRAIFYLTLNRWTRNAACHIFWVKIYVSWDLPNPLRGLKGSIGL
jgi:hypothetical protein